jgi:RNA polymerase-binding transcription factor DksA
MTARKSVTKKTVRKATTSSTKKAKATRTTSARSSSPRTATKATRASAKKATGRVAKAAPKAAPKTAAKKAPKTAAKTVTIRASGKAAAPRATSATPSRSATATASQSTTRMATRAPKIPARKAPFKLSSSDSKHFEELLLTEREKLMREMGHLENNVLNRSLRESSGELSGYSFHMADIGTDSMEREKAFLFASTEGRALIEVNDALRRLYNGQYGECEVCTEPVGKERLEVVPHARLCVSCKENEERSQAGRVL